MLYNMFDYTYIELPIILQRCHTIGLCVHRALDGHLEEYGSLPHTPAHPLPNVMIIGQKGKDLI